ncbi:hypothetical protein [Campylobacter sp. RM16192]|uniref:hypothetical protein n=1 Tax=Campylobacter sp. RM16192 TaxID=1660080 RepID=UPI0014517956|nr:hypothetical protein [Campylobacter sp. RM16192]QCD52497.1 hypothetical protein CDOMC_0874 [Campylobacter sp. RM16192]
MRVIIKFSKFSSTKNISNAKRKIRKFFKRNKIKDRREHFIMPKENFFYKKKIPYKITIPEKMTFPDDFKMLTSKLGELRDYAKKRHSHTISIDHRNMLTIDNTSILLMTVGINSIFKGEKLIKNKKIAPKDPINERLYAIGYWDALCINPKCFGNKCDLEYLKIDYRDGSSINNIFHHDIIEFFTSKDKMLYDYRDGLYDAIFEAMANSKEHAFIDFDGDKKIWFMGAYNKDEKELEFIFYDTGIGIFKSLESEKNKFSKAFHRLSRRIGKANTLRTLCKSNLSKYKDKNKNRGFGMIAFKNFIDTIKNSSNRDASLEVATDEFLYSTKNDTIIRLKSKMQGTFVRWSIRGVSVGV